MLLVVNLAFFAWNFREASTFAQQPPETDPFGIPFLKVNINPTPVAPVVNINPSGQTPQVEVTRMPEIVVPQPPQAGCDQGGNFETGVGPSVSGPIALGFLNLAQPAMVTFVDGDGRNFAIDLAAAPQLGSAIYLRAGQRLEFESDTMFSGCRP
jgi:hypothetical protein